MADIIKQDRNTLDTILKTYGLVPVQPSNTDTVNGYELSYRKNSTYGDRFYLKLRTVPEGLIDELKTIHITSRLHICHPKN